MTTLPRVLLIDDDVDLATMLAQYLTQESFSVHMVHDGESGAQAALTGEFDILVLDVMLPRKNGVEVLRQIRSSGTTTSQLPVLMLTARGDDIDRIVGLELGADDYVPKPCTPRELVARLRAILRRGQAQAEQAQAADLEVGALRMSPAQRSASWAGKALDLTGTEFNLLEVLARNVGKVVSKNTLSERGLGRSLARFDRSIDVHVSAIRQKLGERADGQSRIQTVRGMGYQLIQD